MTTPRNTRPSVEELGRRYRAISPPDSSVATGFSARLNLLWDLAGVVPGQLEGRVLAILALNPEWRETDIRRWLQQDVLPARPVLRSMVHFLVAELGEEHDPLRWEAFLVYGAPIVSSPLEHLLYRADSGRREIAARIIARLTERFRIPPSSYDAAALFQHCLRLMQQFNIYEWQDFQAGHLELFHNLLFAPAQTAAPGGGERPADTPWLPDEKAGFPLPSGGPGENTVGPGKE